MTAPTSSSSSSVHLEGMGLLGSMLAWHLHRAGVPFTWEDANRVVAAWPASTGLIYPSGDPADQEGYRGWRSWVRDGAAPWGPELGADLAEECAFWYVSKGPPHGARYKPVLDLGALRLAPEPAFTLNVQEFVRRSRIFFRAARVGAPTERPVPSATDGARRVIAHGFSRGPAHGRLHHVVWGWSADATLEIDSRILRASGGRRPELYMQVGRFLMKYANPIPGTPFYYAGSATVPQSTDGAKFLSATAAKQLASWREHVERVSAGLVRVVETSAPREGWRPAGAPDDTFAVRVGADDGLIVLPSMRASGVRLSPMVCREALDALGISPAGSGAAQSSLVSVRA